MFYKIKDFFYNQKFYLSVLFSFMLNTICSRLVDQTDLIMLKKLGDNYTAALITLKNFTFIDFIIAFTFVPLFSVMIRKGVNLEAKYNLLRAYTQKFLYIVLISFFICSFAYPLLIMFFVKDIELQKLTYLFLIPVILNIPGKLLQYYGTSILCSFNKANYVSIIWIGITISNFILNVLFIKLFRAIGCLISTTILTLIICIIIYSILQKNFQLFKKPVYKIHLVEIKQQILSEGFRIIIEKLSGYFGFLIILHYSNIQFINWTGISSEIISLFFVPLIASMRSSTITFSEDIKNSIEIKNKITINILFTIILSIFFVLIFNILIQKVYLIEDISNTFFIVFRITFPLILFLSSLNNIFIGFLQFKLKQSFYFIINSVINWCIFLPALFLLFKFHVEQYYILIFVLTIFLETLFTGIKCKSIIQNH